MKSLLINIKLPPTPLLHQQHDHKHADISQRKRQGRPFCAKASPIDVTETLTSSTSILLIGRSGSLRESHWLTFIWPQMTYLRLPGNDPSFPSCFFLGRRLSRISVRKRFNEFSEKALFVRFENGVLCYRAVYLWMCFIWCFYSAQALWQTYIVSCLDKFSYCKDLNIELLMFNRFFPLVLNLIFLLYFSYPRTEISTLFAIYYYNLNYYHIVYYIPFAPQSTIRSQNSLIFLLCRNLF